MKGDIDECHSRQDLILGIITDGNVFDEDGKVSAELVTQRTSLVSLRLVSYKTLKTDSGR